MSKRGVEVALSCIGARGGRVGGAATLAVLLAVGLTVAPPNGRQVPTETHSVHSAAVLLTAVENGSVLVSHVRPADRESFPHSAASQVGGQAMLPAAMAAAEAEEAEESFLDTPLGTLLIAVNFLAMPLWFFATPFTLPLSMFVAASQVTMDGPFGTLQFLIATGLGFISGPISLLMPFLQGSASAAAADAPAAGRSVLADDAPTPTGAAQSAKAAVDEDDLASLSIRNETSSTDQRSRVRLVERQIGTQPRAVAAQAAGTASVTDGRVAVDPSQEVDAGEAMTPATAADPDRSATVEGSSQKAKASKPRSLR